MNKDGKRCTICQATDNNNRSFVSNTRLALHMLTQPNHEVEDLLDKGVPIWNYIRPNNILTITSELLPGQKLPN